MTKKKIIIAAGVFILLLLGGYKYIEHQENKEQKQQKTEQIFWSEQKIRIEKFIKYNFNDIETVTFTETYKTPMSVGIHGYVNNDEENLYFSATIYNEQDTFEADITVHPELDKLSKEPYHVFSVSEIEELEE
ncbi:DUF1433 domain-containing protein [Isobaculum melis]|uniref:DUF1433 domain-containing protein n=1 Tax=Isobaculum melis TaxID=142588 RepID=A0A1H9UL48_9LACT|nr:DUF1433 domain-containing protein [Isobaculum melis]SES10176.1 Protein of unknown function [Isobaculum melis]